MVAHGHFEWLLAEILDIERQSVFQEAQGKLILTHSMENQANIALKEEDLNLRKYEQLNPGKNTNIEKCDIRMIIATDEERQVAGTVEEFEGCADLTVSEAVQCQVRL